MGERSAGNTSECSRRMWYTLFPQLVLYFKKFNTGKNFHNKKKVSKIFKCLKQSRFLSDHKGFCTSLHVLIVTQRNDTPMSCWASHLFTCKYWLLFNYRVLSYILGIRVDQEKVPAIMKLPSSEKNS